MNFELLIAAGSRFRLIEKIYLLCMRTHINNMVIIGMRVFCAWRGDSGLWHFEMRKAVEWVQEVWFVWIFRRSAIAMICLLKQTSRFSWTRGWQSPLVSIARRRHPGCRPHLVHSASSRFRRQSARANQPSRVFAFGKFAVAISRILRSCRPPPRRSAGERHFSAFRVSECAAFYCCQYRADLIAWTCCALRLRPVSLSGKAFTLAEPHAQLDSRCLQRQEGAKRTPEDIAAWERSAKKCSNPNHFQTNNQIQTEFHFAGGTNARPFVR